MIDDTISACIAAKLEALHVELGTSTSPETLVYVSLRSPGFYTPEELRVLREVGAREFAEEFLRDKEAAP
jgi:purine nucleoside phosphorylase